MKRSVQIYIEGNRLDLFDDETISLNSSVQTIKDISKVFNDFTQSFSVPASDKNNEIFAHFYQSEVLLTNGGFIDFQIKRNATIEIDYTTFRTGKMALEKANLKDGQPSSYQITFYGELTALKDLFGERMLSELDWSAYNHTYTYSEVKDRITDGTTDYDVRYPLVSSERYWQYNNPATPAENIDTSGGAISWLELFPALKLRRVLETIETEFGIEFLGGWIDDDRFDQHFGLFKNTNSNTYSTPAIPIDFIATYDINGLPVTPTTPVIDLTANSIDIDYLTYPSYFGTGTIDLGNHKVRATISNITDPTATYYIDIYNNGALESSASGIGNATLDLLNIVNTNNPSLDKTYTFEFRSTAPVTADIDLDYEFGVQDPLLGYIPLNFVQIECNNVATSTLLNLGINAPEVSVASYFANILKMFNLTCIGLGNNQYLLESLEDWYLTGSIIDITEHTEVTDIEVERIKLYKKIAFTYKECKSIVNRFFASTFSREYGNLEAVYQYEGGEFKIDLEFENILFSKFENTPLQVAYCLDENLNPYTPNPIILSIYPEQSVNFYLTDETTPQQVTSYVPFGQDSLVASQEYSLNWGAEISSLLETTIGNGLYSEYYSGYIENLYNFRNRLVKVQCKLPLSILTTLALNDRLVIADKRYLIDTFTTDLTTGVTKFELLLDFRDLLASGGTIKPVFDVISVPSSPNPPKYVGKYYKYIPFLADTDEINITESTAFGVTTSPATINEAQEVTFILPDNPDPVKPLIDEELNSNNKEVFILSENGLHIQNEVGIDREIRMNLEYSNGSSTTDQTLIIKQTDIVYTP